MTNNKVLIEALEEATRFINGIEDFTVLYPNVPYSFAWQAFGDMKDRLNAALASYAEQDPQEIEDDSGRYPGDGENGPWYIREEEIRCSPESGDMSVDVKTIITNGKVSLLTNDVESDEDLKPIVNALNASNLKFYGDDTSKIIADYYQRENAELIKEIEKLEGQVTGKSAGVWVKEEERWPKKDGAYVLRFSDGEMRIEIFRGGYWVDPRMLHPQHFCFEWLDESGEAGKLPEQQSVDTARIHELSVMVYTLSKVLAKKTCTESEQKMIDGADQYLRKHFNPADALHSQSDVSG